MPFGGKYQRTPTQVMAALLPVLPGQETDQASVMAWGFDPYEMSADPYRGAYHGVVTSLAKLVAAGADYRKAYLTLQEFFEKLRDDPRRWGKPFAALLGPWTPSWTSARRPSAARTPCPAPSTTWMCPPR